MPYSIVGRVIDAKKAPVPGLLAQVVAPAGMLGGDTVLAEARTDVGGRFTLDLDEGKTGGMLGRLGRTPKVALTLRDAAGAVLLTSRPHALEWQIEYRVYLGGGSAESKVPDIYAAGMRRMVAMSRDAGLGSQMTGTMQKMQSGTQQGGWKKPLALVQSSPQAGDSVNMMFGIMDGMAMDQVEATPFKVIGYDGAQVPKQAWDGPDNQVIIWPRKEPFKWA